MVGLRLGHECGAQHDQASATATRQCDPQVTICNPSKLTEWENHSSVLFTRYYNRNCTSASHCHLYEGTKGIHLLSRQLLRTGGGVSRLTKSQMGLAQPLHAVHSSVHLTLDTLNMIPAGR